MDSLGLLRAAASGMDAQRAVLDVAARNVAAAQAAGPSGSFSRSVPELRVVDVGDETSVAFTGMHQEAANGVDAITEMIAVMNASRAFESNASLFDVGKTLAEKTIDMGRS